MVEPLFLVHGDDQFLVTNEAQRLRTELTSDLVSDLGLEEFRSSRDLEAIEQSLATPPFMAIRRAVFIWDPPQIVPASRSPKDLEHLTRVLGLRLETTAVCVVVRLPLPPASAFIRAVRALGGEVRTMTRPRGRELQRYVEDRLRRRKLQVGRAVQLRLVEAAAADLGRVESELEKLAIYSAGSDSVSDRAGLLLVAATPPTELYRLTDALFESPAQLGARLTEISSRLNLQSQLVVGALARVFRDLIAFGDGGDGRWRALPPWRQERMSRHRSIAGEPRLRRWLVELADLDWSIRTGKVDPDDGLELTLARMAEEMVRPSYR